MATASRRLSEQLRDILDELGDKWEEQIAAMQGIIRELRAGQASAGEELPDLPEHALPFFRLLVDETIGEAARNPERAATIMDLTVEIVQLISDELTENFWRPNKKPDQDALATRIFEHLIKADIVEMDAADALVDKVMDLARANHRKLMDS